MNLAASVHQWAKGKLSHERIRSSTLNLKDILKEDINVVHLQRSPALPAISSHLKALVTKNPGLSLKASIPVRNPEENVSQRLLSGPSWQRRSLGEDQAAIHYLHEDICSIVQSYGETLGSEEVDVKLQVLQSTMCPRWHADHVGVRLLCTYIGQGTWWIENRHVMRNWVLQEGELVPVVEGVDEEHAQQVDTGDLLLLKGHKWPGNQGKA
ncbi:hypothetical protein CEUSTIGMA_g3274.t1 [Chlamydomonas eustigma]|uniref:Uncharacterized protein n=1 Tax=Chlamydomonas eustigma TaxID=1157962 RepID=A0A250WYC9_9CHLO|nr:hypothetical protein CEUSTIGMA_g3274.t1 [Chlamydomonas eustigma]|eukprot:GAX75831.1 hypothetical protein CEUSTIGMA_g3274.t1 [Chlamydomonas eustigma]